MSKSPNKKHLVTSLFTLTNDTVTVSETRNKISDKRKIKVESTSVYVRTLTLT